jgi:formylglycine-generating enzyme required for sulfatase activity
MVCMSGKCQPPTCFDGVQNGSETDKDCGGPTCPPCTDGLMCSVASDCKSSVCDPAKKTCSVPTCNDKVLNGNETDIDCGGPMCPFCGTGKKCAQGNDCLSQNCNLKQCACPLGMIIIPSGGTSYCMDANEVTYDDYSKFYANNPDKNSQPAYCLWNVNYTPPNNWPAAVGKQAYPVTDVNWCDAYAYCKFAGKHLCGKVGGVGPNGQPNDPANAAVAASSEWFNACTSQGTSTYPYGQTFDLKRCQGADNPLSNVGWQPPSPAQVCASNNCTNSRAENDQVIDNCQGGAPGLFQMSGNVAEWEDSCDAAAGQNDNCLARGGSHCDLGPDGLACAATRKLSRSYAGCDVGIRCCF